MLYVEVWQGLYNVGVDPVTLPVKSKLADLTKSSNILKKTYRTLLFTIFMYCIWSTEERNSWLVQQNGDFTNFCRQINVKNKFDYFPNLWYFLNKFRRHQTWVLEHFYMNLHFESIAQQSYCSTRLSYLIKGRAIDCKSRPKRCQYIKAVHFQRHLAHLLHVLFDLMKTYLFCIYLPSLYYRP